MSNVDPIPHPARTAFFTSRGRTTPTTETRTDTAGAERRTTARDRYFASKRTTGGTTAARTEPTALTREAERIAARDAADRARLEAKRTTPDVDTAAFARWMAGR